jgi:hexulose-6-phosphate isomerase
MYKNDINRRTFIKYSTAAAASALAFNQAIQAQQNNSKLLKAIQFHMLPKELSDLEKFKLAKKCGFEGIEINADANRTEKDAAELGKMARDAGVPIHSIVFGGWGAPLSDPDPKVTQKGIDGMKQTLRNAKAFGADAVLLVPAFVKEDVSYDDAYKRSQENVQKLIPTAADLEVVIAVENVWNKFLLSPLEFARYVDEFESPWLRAYFDVGNVIIYGFAQHWIRILDKRIVKIHLKDFKRKGYQWTNLLDGDVNWPEVAKALAEVGYKGYLTPELGQGDEKYLTDLSRRVDKIINM